MVCFCLTSKGETVHQATCVARSPVSFLSYFCLVIILALIIGLFLPCFFYFFTFFTYFPKYFILIIFYHYLPIYFKPLLHLNTVSCTVHGVTKKYVHYFPRSGFLIELTRWNSNSTLPKDISIQPRLARFEPAQHLVNIFRLSATLCSVYFCPKSDPGKCC